MSVLLSLSVLAVLVGLLLYFLPVNPKVQEVGRMTYFAGLLTFLLQVGPQVVSLLD